MNKKGEVTVIFTGLVIAGVISAILMTPAFRVRKAKEKCIDQGYSKIYCDVKVNLMSKDEVLDYIKDK